MSPVARVVVFLAVLVVILLLEGSIGKAYREFAGPIAILLVVWSGIGVVWGLRGLYRFITR